MGQSSSKADLADILSTLSQTDVSPEAHDFWDELWKLSTTPEDIFELIPPEDVRSLKENRPENLVTLFTQAVAQLCQIVHTPVPMYFGQALNCVRVLTRVLPFLVEGEQKGRAANSNDTETFSERLCWSVEEDEAQEESPEEKPQPLARLVVHAAMHLLFLPGFTVEASAFDDVEDDAEEAATIAAAASATEEDSITEAANGGESVAEDASNNDEKNTETLKKKDAQPAANHSLPQAALWAAGLGGFEARPASSAAFDRNRTEVLRLLLASVCEPLFQSADTYDPWKSRWLETATDRDAPNARLLFYSLCNTIFSYDPTGFGVPYAGALFSSEAPTILVNVSTQVLVALLDFGGGADAGTGFAAAAAAMNAKEDEKRSSTKKVTDGENTNATTTTEVVPERTNVFRRFLSEIDGPEAFDFVFEGFARLLNNVHEALNTTLPGSLAQIECGQELLVLLWKFLEENENFTPYVLRHCDVTRLVVPICFLMYQARRDPAKVGLVHICTFTLLKLSGERPFCVALNKPFNLRLPVDLPLFEGSHADLVMITLHKMVVNGGDKLAPLYNCFLTILCNLSPYAKSLSLVTSVKLVNLFELFTSPRFLYQNPTNHAYVALLLEIFNNVIQYQYGGNPHLVYAVVRRRHVFENLDDLTLPVAVAEAKGLGTTQTAQNNANANGNNNNDEQPAVPSASTTAVALATETRDPNVEAGAVVAEEEKQHQRELHTQQHSPAKDAAAPNLQQQQQEREAEEDDHKNPPTEQPFSRQPLTKKKPAADYDKAHSEIENAEKRGEAKKLSQPGPRFVPTQEWLDRVKAELPLNTIMRLLQHLGPQIEELVHQSEFALDETAVLDFIKNTTMVGLLPVPHAIVIRKYQPNAFTSLWFTAFMWGVIFLQNQQLPLFDGQAIKLFTVSVVN